MCIRDRVSTQVHGGFPSVVFIPISPTKKKKLFVEVLGAYETQRVMQIIDSQLSPLDGVDLTQRRGIVRNLIQSILDAHAISPRFHREVMAMRYADPEIGAHYLSLIHI
eukprot:TRINITY_DN42511_c0_g1_i1.p1 TRINITY_DN42511_c0_g1~~TRINITY_DN42511_c0_g1_i1.p1  ORF type:complete len:109 (-),score=12.11 TRINITY_DN42511_c0_g1_i1:141-467(-)